MDAAWRLLKRVIFTELWDSDRHVLLSSGLLAGAEVVISLEISVKGQQREAGCGGIRHLPHQHENSESLTWIVDAGLSRLRNSIDVSPA